MVIVLLTLMILIMGSSGAYMCTDSNSVTNLHVDQRLTGHTFLSMETSGLMVCAKECLKRKRCKSINFKPGTCELNLNTNSEVGTLVSTSEYYYYEIEHVNSAVAGVCETNTCTEDQVCLANISTPVCDQCSNASECGICSNIWETSNQRFSSYGCFHGRALPHLVVNLRTDIEWDNMAQTIRDCAAAAYAAGYELFGIEFWGECYGGNYSEGVFNNPVSVSICADTCWAGAAAASTTFVYRWL